MAAAADARAQADRLKITEVFVSLQGEALTVGVPTVFIRLTGCPLRCGYCDTAYAFSGGDWHSIDGLLGDVASYGVRHVCVTGGEPLAQSRCLTLLERLCDAGYSVSLETSGALDIAPVDSRVSRIVDVKTPGSGEVDRNRWGNFELLTARDAVKFVIVDRNDYEWARQRLKSMADVPCEIFFSPSYGELAPDELARWILEDRLPVRMQLQLHKVLWGDERGR